MFKNYLLFSLKRILKLNNYALINIIGLAIGMASSILIGLYVFDEYSFDKYHSKFERIYRITSVLDFNGVGEKSSSQPFPLGQAMLEVFPDYVETYVRFFNLQKSQFMVSYHEKIFNEKRFFYCDKNVFDVFDFELIKGNKSTVLEKPFSIVITESIARKYFEDENPIGKKILVENSYEFEVSGVVKDIKQQSHFKFDFLASFATLPYLFRNEKIMKGWVWNPCWTYVLLKDEKSAELLGSRLDEFVKKHMKINDNESYSFYLQPLTDIHLKSELAYEIEKNGSEKYVRFLTGLAILILIIASINYINLATASAANRAKEIGIKKASGASRTNLIFQFLSESMITTFISLLIAISLVELFLPAFSYITGKIITRDFRFMKDTLLGIFSIWFFTGVVSGLYPALFLSSFRTNSLLKNNFKLGTRSTNFRKVLVLIQFSISVLLIISTFGVFKQLRYLHNADLGFKKNNIVIIDAPYDLTRVFSKFKQELLNDTNIKQVTAMNYIIGSSHNIYPFLPEGYSSSEFQFYPAILVRDDFVKTFEIQLLAGRDIVADEKSAGLEMLVNEEMVRYLGYEKNEDILNKYFFDGSQNVEVVGVFSNLNVTSLHSQVEPFVISMAKDSALRNYETKFIVIQINQDNISGSLSYIENVWDKFDIEQPFEYRFLQDILDAHYRGEEVLGDLARIFTILSIIIASLGIWGLTAYITERRTREIGIRKALGASLYSIVRLINKEFIIIIILSNLIAWPLAYFALRSWINSFAYRDFLSIWSFILASMLAIFIAVLTISHKSIEAGRKNPIDALHYE